MDTPEFELTSRYACRDGESVYHLTLRNRSAHSLSGFRLGLSGPARIGLDAEIKGGVVSNILSNWCEITPEDGFMLKADGEWVIIIKDNSYQLHHWTEGTTSACVILQSGEAVNVTTHPTVCEESVAPRSGPVKLPADQPTDARIGVVPWPNRVEVAGARDVEGLAISASDAVGSSAVSGFEKLTAALFPAEGLVRSMQEGGCEVALINDRSIEGEAYQLLFFDEAIKVHASTTSGFLYGLITLGQMVRGARRHPERFSFPSKGTISDAPSMAWRGCHLDVARRYYPKAEVAQFLNVLAWNKLNRFHWHLSDDEAWRVEIEAYPELTSVGAWRGVGMPIPPLLGSGAERSGGFYSRSDVKELVDHALGLGIEIIPEIDIPGHCYAMLEALPQLKDPNESGTYFSIQSFPNNCLNPAKPEVFKALEIILGELCDLFPSRYFHVGADEVPEDAWTGSPLAIAMLEQRGDKHAAALQALFLQQVQTFLTSKGKITGAWEEAAQGGGIDPEHCYLVGWHSVEIAQKLASEGYQVVVSPGQAYYLDMANGPEWEEPGASWAGYSSPQTTYEFVPAKGWSDAERACLMGVQACIWSEPMRNRAVFDRLVFPRLSAVAEAGWTSLDNKDWARFSSLVGLMPSLHNSDCQSWENPNA